MPGIKEFQEEARLHPEVEKLLKLQTVDARLEILRKELERRPRQSAAQEEHLMSIQEKLDRHNDHVTKKKIELDRYKLEVQAATDKIADTEKRQAESSSTKEFSGFSIEIERANAQKGKFEEKVFAADAELGAMKTESTELEAELASAKEDHEEEEQHMLEELDEIRQEGEKLIGAREEALAPIAEPTIEMYTRLFGRYKERSVVSADGGVCSGCHITVNPQMLNQLHTCEEVVVCKNCSRILFL